jgi:predicted signal transduction protein with EAL and GGDEF domain
MIVPPVFAGVMLGLFAMQYFSATSGLSTVLWAATMTAVIVRLAMSDRENKALLEQIRTDPLTRLANQGRMQVDLPIKVGRASKESPVMLLLFDLNGFKQGRDSRLARPGARSRSPVRRASPRPPCSSPMCACMRRRSHAAWPTRTSWSRR